MPLYEYECFDCDEKFEVLVIDTDETIKCMSCDSVNIGKLFSTFGLGGSDESLEISESSDSGGCSQSSCGCCY
ncbi:MAG: zinc ribbon domain-containing protein [Candidatus Dadabacteria bacterium]|nr:zinc ribbon domain-containing protein [Candidatus Dadabacteria bacterium]